MTTPLVGITEEDLQVFRRHMARFPGAHQCPVCGNSGWGVLGISAPSIFVSGADGRPPGVQLDHFVPMVVASCLTCAFVRQFAWLRIVNADKEARGV